MPIGNISAHVITCPGRLGDFEYTALQIDIAGFSSPYVLTLALPAIGCRALGEQIEPAKLYKALARSINDAQVIVELPDSDRPPEKVA